MSRASKLNSAEIVRLYVAGQTLRGIGAVMGCSHELVRKILHQSGVALRSRHGVGKALSDLAVEIFADLEDHFHGVATVTEIHEWIGGDLIEMRCALATLAQRGWIVRDGERCTVRTNPAYKPKELSDRNAAILRLRKQGRGYAAIANDLETTVGVVAGVCHRARLAT